MKPYRRPVNTVFQSYALFPHLSIADNVAFGLRRRGRKQVDEQVARMLELVELGHLGKRRPAQLSGGQQQRVALARALINEPQVLLLDEPLGALDLKLRRQMQIELKRIQAEVGLTFVHVTHDQEEAMTMADTVAVMNEGASSSWARPRTCTRRLRPTFVANFLGQSNLVAGTVRGRDGAQLLVEAHGARLCARQDRARVDGGDAWVGVRPEKVYLVGAGEDRGDGVNTLPAGVVSDVSFVGVSTQYLVRMPWGQELTVFEQNTGRATGSAPATRSTCTGAPSTRSSSTRPGRRGGRPAGGRDERRRPPARRARRPAGGPHRRGRRRGLAGYLLLLPGALWLILFFVVPTVTLVATSLYDPTGSLETGLRDDRALAELRRLDHGDYAPQIVRSLSTRGSRRWPASCSATRWRTRSRSRPGAGRT